MLGRNTSRGARGRGRLASGQRPVSEHNRIGIAEQLAEFQASHETGWSQFVIQWNQSRTMPDVMICVRYLQSMLLILALTIMIEPSCMLSARSMASLRKAMGKQRNSLSEQLHKAVPDNTVVRLAKRSAARAMTELSQSSSRKARANMQMMPLTWAFSTSQLSC